MSRLDCAAIASTAIGLAVMVFAFLWWLSGYGEAASANSGNTPGFYVMGYVFLVGIALFIVGGLVSGLRAGWWIVRMIRGRDERAVR